MTRSPVKSSHIRSVGYDEATRTLQVEFNNGKVFNYADVPLAVHREMIYAESVGRYFHAAVKSRYEAEPVSEEQG